jgi:3-phenylpropionate/cinnamic acid dioxygenase small subunit
VIETGELAAREAIRDLVARYNQSGDAGRIEELLALFCRDAILELDQGRYHGRMAISRVFAAATSQGADGSPPDALPGGFVRHFISTHQIDVEGPDAARGRLYFCVLTARGLDHWGRYQDAYRREEGRWRFASRRVRVDGEVAGGWGEGARARLPDPGA